MKEFRFNRIIAAILASFSNWRRAATTTSIGIITYFFFAFNTNIPWNMQILSQHPLNFPRVLQLGTVTMLQAGSVALGLKILYAVLIGITIANFGLQIRRKNLSKSSLTSLGPGVIAGGCGCGVGLLSFLGLAGATALLPFNGTLVIIGGVALMIYALNDMGDPEKCDVKVSFGEEN